MFEGVIERKSHENGLLASFSGSSPALGSIMILQNSEDYVGKVDSVLCNADDPLIHIAHLDFKADINAMIGQKIIIMTYQKIGFNHDIGVTEIQRLGAFSLKGDIANIPDTLIGGISQFPRSIKANQFARQAKR